MKQAETNFLPHPIPPCAASYLRQDPAGKQGLKAHYIIYADRAYKTLGAC